MRSHESKLFFAKCTSSDPLVGPRGQISYLEKNEHDIDIMFDQNWMKNVGGVVLTLADNTICL